VARLGIALAAVSVLVAAAQVFGASAARPPQNFDIFSIRLDGSGKQQLTSDPVEEVFPAVSPDGRKVAYERGNFRFSDSEIWIMNADGTGQRRIADTPGTTQMRPTWSPNGRWIAFTSVDPSSCRPGERNCATWSVWIVRPDGTGLRQIRGGGGVGERFPRWSPNGRKLAFEADIETGDSYSIFVADLAGGGRRVARGIVSHPSWSPDGRWIVFHLNIAQNDDQAAYMVRADGRARRRLATAIESNSGPEWSPAAQRVAVARFVRGANGFGVYLVPVRGGRAKRVALAYSFVWSPRGKRLALTKEGGIFVVNADGRGLRRVTSEPGGWVGWTPGGGRLVFSAPGAVPPPPA
jgi:Tol biopolymer transport system component